MGLDTVELIMDIEDRLGVELPSDESRRAGDLTVGGIHWDASAARDLGLN